MPPNPYQRALARRADLRKELAEVDEFIRLWAKFSDAESGTDGEHLPVPVIHAGLKGAPSLTLTAPEVSENHQDRVKRVARKLILDAGRPLTRGKLVKAFAEACEPIGGKDPLKNMGTTMWRLNYDFVNI